MDGEDREAEAPIEPGDALPPLPWHAYVPGGALVAAMAAAWIAHFGSGGMSGWGVSGAALAQGRYETIALHMFAHGPIFHILMNGIVLFEIAPVVVERLGGFPAGWGRFLLLFILSGLAGMGMFLAIHPRGEVPMLGASGAIYGLVGLLLRLQAPGKGLAPLRSRAMAREALDFLTANLVLVVLLTVPAMLAGLPGGVAWEAHLGGFLFGLLLAPHLFARDRRTRPD